MFPPALPPPTTIRSELIPRDEALDLHFEIGQPRSLVAEVGVKAHPFQNVEAIVDGIWKLVFRRPLLVSVQCSAVPGKNNCRILHAVVDTDHNDVSHTGDESVLGLFNLVAANDPAYELG